MQLQLARTSSLPLVRAARPRPAPQPPGELDLALDRWRLADTHARCYEAYLRWTVGGVPSDKQQLHRDGLRLQEARALAQVMAHMRLAGYCDLPETMPDA